MIILGIHDGHTATACIFENGKILGMASEERFTKKKNQGGFPLHAIKWLLEANNINPSDLDKITFPGYLTPIEDISAYDKDRHNWFKKASKFLPGNVLSSTYLKNVYVQKNRAKREKLDYYNEQFAELGLDKNKTEFFEHHDCHAATSYYLDRNFAPDRKVLVLTLDGSGDGLSGTINIGYKNKLERIGSIPSYHSLGIIYSRLTSYLGMKPLEHEYKLMGMAPYAPQFLKEKSYNVIKNYITLDKTGLHFENNTGVWGDEMLKLFQKDLFKHRFDGICAGLQQHTEEIALQWILNWIKETGIKDICLSGGVFMNVKLNMLINEHPEIGDVFFMPSCGDESIGLGAALLSYKEQNPEEPIETIKNIYFGPDYSSEKIERALQTRNDINYHYYDDINSVVVEMLIQDKNIGRCNGKMEFGARALGNRTIIANPSKYENVSKINRAIKMRDFWMPFAPSILPSGAKKYLKTTIDNPYAPYMILGFETQEIAHKDIIAGLHQSDFSCRPQIVEKDFNPEYHDLLSKFEAATGISGVLNTSFNIHGYPIVNTPEDAIWTLENSDLDAIQIGNFLVTKK